MRPAQSPEPVGVMDCKGHPIWEVSSRIWGSEHFDVPAKEPDFFRFLKPIMPMHPFFFKKLTGLIP
jgi:hypothetical protein